MKKREKKKKKKRRRRRKKSLFEGCRFIWLKVLIIITIAIVIEIENSIGIGGSLLIQVKAEQLSQQQEPIGDLVRNNNSNGNRIETSALQEQPQTITSSFGPSKGAGELEPRSSSVGFPAISENLLLFALLVLINLIVISGNILVIVAVYASAKLRSVTNIFIVSLATADLMLGLFVMPYALTFQMLDIWIFGKIWCTGWLVTDVWISTASILNLCAISVDRYVAVTRPVKYKSIMTPRKAKTIVAGVWIVSFLICFPPLLQQLNGNSLHIAQQKPQESSNVVHFIQEQLTPNSRHKRSPWPFSFDHQTNSEEAREKEQEEEEEEGEEQVQFNVHRDNESFIGSLYASRTSSNTTAEISHNLERTSYPRPWKGDQKGLVSVEISKQPLIRANNSFDGTDRKALERSKITSTDWLSMLLSKTGQKEPSSSVFGELDQLGASQEQLSFAGDPLEVVGKFADEFGERRSQRAKNWKLIQASLSSSLWSPMVSRRERRKSSSNSMEFLNGATKVKLANESEKNLGIEKKNATIQGFADNWQEGPIRVIDNNSDQVANLEAGRPNLVEFISKIRLVNPETTPTTTTATTTTENLALKRVEDKFGFRYPSKATSETTTTTERTSREEAKQALQLEVRSEISLKVGGGMKRQVDAELDLNEMAAPSAAAAYRVIVSGKQLPNEFHGHNRKATDTNSRLILSIAGILKEQDNPNVPLKINSINSLKSSVNSELPMEAIESYSSETFATTTPMLDSAFPTDNKTSCVVFHCQNISPATNGPSSSPKPFPPTNNWLDLELGHTFASRMSNNNSNNNNNNNYQHSHKSLQMDYERQSWPLELLLTLSTNYSYNLQVQDLLQLAQQAPERDEITGDPLFGISFTIDNETKEAKSRFEVKIKQTMLADFKATQVSNMETTLNKRIPDNKAPSQVASSKLFVVGDKLAKAAAGNTVNAPYFGSLFGENSIRVNLAARGVASGELTSTQPSTLSELSTQQSFDCRRRRQGSKVSSADQNDGVRFIIGRASFSQSSSRLTDKGIDYECYSHLVLRKNANLVWCRLVVDKISSQNEGAQSKEKLPEMRAKIRKKREVSHRLCRRLSILSKSSDLKRFCQPPNLAPQEGKNLNDIKTAYGLCLLLSSSYCGLPSQSNLIGEEDLVEKSPEKDKHLRRLKRQTKASLGDNEESNLSFEIHRTLQSHSSLSEDPGKTVASFHKKNLTGNLPRTSLEQNSIGYMTSSISPLQQQQQQQQQLPLAKQQLEGRASCALFDDTSYVIYSALGSFYIPMLVMIFFYSRIYLVASRAHKAMQRGYMTTKWPSSSSKSSSFAKNTKGLVIDDRNINNSTAGMLLTGGSYTLTSNGEVAAAQEGCINPERVTLRIHRGEKKITLQPNNAQSKHQSDFSSLQTSPTMTTSLNGSLSKTNLEDGQLIKLSLEEQRLQVQLKKEKIESEGTLVVAVSDAQKEQKVEKVSQQVENPLKEKTQKTITEEPKIQPTSRQNQAQEVFNQPKTTSLQDEKKHEHQHYHHHHHQKHHHHHHTRHHHHHNHRHHHPHHHHHHHHHHRHHRDHNNQHEANITTHSAISEGCSQFEGSLNSVQITVSHYDDLSGVDHEQQNNQEDEIPMMDECESSSNLQVVTGSSRRVPEGPSTSTTSLSGEGVPNLAESVTDGRDVERLTKQEHRKSIELVQRGRIMSATEPRMVPISTTSKLNGNSTLLTGFGRTGRANSCEPTPTIVVDWPMETSDGGSGGVQTENHSLIKSTPSLAVQSDSNQVQTKLQLSSDDRPSGSQGSGLSMMANIPNQVRKQSMMLLSTLTTRSSQTLRRLSMVASHPVESLLNLSKSRDSSSTTSTDNSCFSSEELADLSTDPTGRTQIDKNNNDERRRKRRRQRRHKKKRNGQQGTKKTFDDYLMAVAGIDNSSDEDVDYAGYDENEDFVDEDEHDDDDDDEDDIDYQNQSDNNHRNKAPSSLTHSLLFRTDLTRQQRDLTATRLSSTPLTTTSVINVTNSNPQGFERDNFPENSNMNELEQPLVSQEAQLGNQVADLKSPPDGQKSTKIESSLSEDEEDIKKVSDMKVASGTNKSSAICDHQQMLRPSSGLQRKGGYYERATSRDGNSNSNAEQVNRDFETSRSVLSNLVSGKSNTVSSMAVNTSLTKCGAPAIGGSCPSPKGRLGARRRKHPSRWHAKRLRAETKAAKTVAIIIGGFIFCWLPFFTAYLSRAIICDKPDCIPQSLLSFFIWLGYLNSAINPVIYGLFSADFRHAFKNIVCRCRFRNTDDTIVVSALVDSIIKSIL